ncbi:putative ABC-type amino acid transport/signal transduction systems, periplasmic component/domain [Vibrio nigripulchritudo SOn1]|uniref:ABC-type amino acid transport/signal transduction systems, periplasmic component/domain n=1 Tax=Vibrio nigripulchritudo SOn1 TaxID=1238450 RepID=A0AAV2VVS2_9VIBR|nr:transporter substrate-binding domain-containing protein [Vibrio nigripulchritudo]CCO48484.1 putative ABC-type amino acid transport/signal transduction systems, periplasmic component/domain [Vibrio nigripulchritudo SOn1]
MNKIALAAIALCSLIKSPDSNADTLVLTSLEWPPYTSQYLSDHGASSAVVKAALQAMGHDLEIRFYPWSRAVRLAKNNKNYAGYFPEYHLESDDLLLSDSIGSSILGFVERVKDPIKWSTLSDLKPYSIGVVQDYVNTKELDEKIANGTLRASPVLNDASNIRKLGAERISIAVIDEYVFQYLMENDPKLDLLNGELQMNAKRLENKELFIAFTNDDLGRKWREIINQGLKKIKVNQIATQSLNQ